MLLAGRNYVEKTHYELLSVNEDASYEEIRASYRSTLLISHPDKLKGKFETSEYDEQLQNNFLKIQEAWEILGDPKSRAIYDKELQASREDSEMADDVKLEDMVVEDTGEISEFFYHCRCGDAFSINSVELEEMGISLEHKKGLQKFDVEPAMVLLPCCSCSLKIRLIIQ